MPPMLEMSYHIWEGSLFSSDLSRNFTLVKVEEVIPVRVKFFTSCEILFFSFNPLSANFTKWPNTLKQFVRNLPPNCLSVFGHFCGIGAKRVKNCLVRINVGIIVAVDKLTV